MLKITGVKLEKISDIRKYLFIEKGLREGISYIAKRCINKYIINTWMIMILNVEWLKNVDNFDMMSISGKSPIGYFLEVNLEYLDKLRELHNDYPLAPEKLSVSSDML